jgi:hypothetical protein
MQPRLSRQQGIKAQGRKELMHTRLLPAPRQLLSGSPEDLAQKKAGTVAVPSGLEKE